MFPDELKNKEWKIGDPILVNKIKWDKNELDYIRKVFEADWFGAREFNQEFEDKFASFIGTKFFQTTSSGSSAILAACHTLIHKGILKKGDKILHPALTFPTSISSAIREGLKPVFVDCAPGTYVISTMGVKEAINSHPDIKGAIIPALLGNIPNMDILKEYFGDKPLILDSCDTVGSKWDGKEFGSLGTFGAYSFYGSHHITTAGVGGGFSTNDPELYKLGKSITFWGRDFDVEKKDKITSFLKRYSYETIGTDVQMSNIQAAFGVAQLKRLPGFIKRREEVFNEINSLFTKYKKFFILPKTTSEKSRPSWFCYPLTIKEDSPFTREDFAHHLISKNVEIRPIMAGHLLHQKPYMEIEHHKGTEYTNTLDVTKNGFFIPAPPMEEEQLNHYKKIIEEFLSKY